MTSLACSVSLLCGVAFVGCSASNDNSGEQTLFVAQFAGCTKVLRGPRCVLGSQTSLRFWSPARLKFQARGGEVAVQPSEREGGFFYRLDVPASVEAISCRDAYGGLLTLPLVRRPDRVAAAVELRKNGQLLAARAALVPLLRDDDIATRADALSLDARLQLQLGKLREARSAFSTSIVAQTQADCRSCMGKDALSAAYIDIAHLRDMTSARGLLAAVAEWTEHSELAAQRLYTSALLALHTGDLRSALEILEQARSAAARLDMPVDEAAAREVQATTLMRLGQYEEAATRLRALESVAPSACDRARLLSNLGQVELSALTAWDSPPLSAAGAAPRWDRVETAQQTALRLNLPSGPCPRPLGARHVLLNLAFIALERGDLAAATLHRDAALRISPDSDEQISLRSLTIEGETALAAGQPTAALEIFERCAEHARDVQFPEHEWRAVLGRARANKALGRFDAAMQDYAESEHLLEREVQRAPLNIGKDTFLGARARGQSEYLQLLLQRGLTSEAFELARRVHRRLLVTVSRSERIARLSASERAAWDRTVSDYQREREALESRPANDWKLASSALTVERRERARIRAALDRELDHAFAALESNDPQAELPPLQQGELVLLLHDLGDQVLVLICEREREFYGRTLAVRPAEQRGELLRELVAMLEPRLGGIDKLRVIASGTLEDVDIHALRLSDGPLLQRVAVFYSMDLAANTTLGEDRSSLVIGDARGDLPHARREAVAIREVLQESMGRAAQLRLGEDADAQSLVAALPTLDILHVAGHAEFSERSWHNTLLLAGGTTLGVGDILTLAKTPRLVFLAGCETARASATSPAQSLSIAHAFVAAGTSSAVATTRAVDDKSTQALAKAFYDALPTLHGDAVQALRTAQLKMQALQPAPDWAAFRVITP